MNKILTIVILAVILVLVATPVAAEDFSFDVPVRLNNLHPDFTQGNVVCSVSGPDPSRFGAVSTFGHGGQSFLITGGRYDGVVTIAFNASQARLAQNYRCELSLTRGARSGEGHLGEVRVLELFGRDLSAPLAFLVEGMLPR